MVKISIVGSVGIPANYGGFETLAEQLVLYNENVDKPYSLVVYCSSKNYPERKKNYYGAQLRYISMRANGIQSIIYDILSIIDACIRKSDVVLLLGHGGSFIIPLLRLLTKTKFITNIDGIEWKREKFNWFARSILRISENFAIRFSHCVIADNVAIQQYVKNQFGRDCDVIAYGGDHAVATESNPTATSNLPVTYALALCRIEPENNVDIILTAFNSSNVPLVFVGNWDNSAYGRDLKARFSDSPNIYILNSIYEISKLRAVRGNAFLYIHGHSAGGTNPALVEMMHFRIPIMAYNCSFNIESTEGQAIYFRSATDLLAHLARLEDLIKSDLGKRMYEIARRRYTWDIVGKAYYDLIEQSLNEKYGNKPT